MKKLNIDSILHKCVRISGWLLFVMIIIYFISGYALVHEHGFDKLLARKYARMLHCVMDIPFLILLVMHVFPNIYFRVKRFFKKKSS